MTDSHRGVSRHANNFRQATGAVDRESRIRCEELDDLPFVWGEGVLAPIVDEHDPHCFTADAQRDCCSRNDIFPLDEPLGTGARGIQYHVFAAVFLIVRRCHCHYLVNRIILLDPAPLISSRYEVAHPRWRGAHEVTSLVLVNRYEVALQHPASPASDFFEQFRCLIAALEDLGIQVLPHVVQGAEALTSILQLEESREGRGERLKKLLVPLFEGATVVIRHPPTRQRNRSVGVGASQGGSQRYAEQAPKCGVVLLLELGSFEFVRERTTPAFIALDIVDAHRDSGQDMVAQSFAGSDRRDSKVDGFAVVPYLP